jgi:hypothetical protein
MAHSGCVIGVIAISAIRLAVTRKSASDRRVRSAGRAMPSAASAATTAQTHCTMPNWKLMPSFGPGTEKPKPQKALKNWLGNTKWRA